MKIENITEMTAGATGSGSVASVAQPVGKMQKRAGSLFKGKTTKKPFYEQETTSSIAQGVSEATLSEEDFILMPGQGRKLKPGLISKRPDHEVEMARGDLYQSAKNAKQICDMLSNVSEMQGLDGWVQAKITKASDYLNSVRQYLEGRQQAVSETEKPSAREKFSKGLKKAGYDPEKGADRLFSLLKKQAEEREKFEKAMPAVYGDKEGVTEVRTSDSRNKVEQQQQRAIERIKNSDYPDIIKLYLIAINDPSGPVFKAAYRSHSKGNEAREQLKNIFAQKYNIDPADLENADQNEMAKQVAREGVAEGSLNEFAPDGFNGGDDDEGFSPEIARMAQEDGFTKGVSLADGATLARAIAINYWHSQHGGMYRQYFVKGFRAGRMNKIKFNNKQYNLNLKLMKDGSIRHGEQGVAEGTEEDRVFYAVQDPDKSYHIYSITGNITDLDEFQGKFGRKLWIEGPLNDVNKAHQAVHMHKQKQGVAEGSEQKKLVSDYDTWRDQVAALGGEIHPQQNRNHMVAQSWSGDTIGEFHMGKNQGWITHIQQDMTEDQDPCWKDYRQLGTKKKNGKTVPNCVPKK